MPALPMHAAGRETLASRLDACKGIGPGFDSLRLFLALSIVCVHSLPLAHGFDYYDFRTKTLFPLFLALLPMFFGLSGFLVTGSAKRLLSIPRFLMNRGLRIAPALVVEVTLSAIVLGAAVTTLPWTEYFTDKGFYAYFLNIIGNIHFELPGVFKDNPFPATVNGNLWTLQPEYYCYLVLAGAMLLGIFKHRRLYVALVGIGVLAAIALDIVYKIGNPFYAFSSAALVFAFMAGSLLYMCAAYVPVSGWL
ncbi:MAG TPA: acyltransferase, partial [Burkholderiaceae bacterium]